MFLTFLGLTILIQIVSCQQPSPCPNILSYEPRNLEDDRWYGVLTLRSDEDLTGIFINVHLDRPAQLLGNWFGEISSTDNKEFLIQDGKYRIRARQPITVRFFVKFNRAEVIPSVRVIRFNGKTVCSKDTSSSIEEAINRVENTGIVMRPTSTQRPSDERPIREGPITVDSIIQRPTTRRPERIPISNSYDTGSRRTTSTRKPQPESLPISNSYDDTDFRPTPTRRPQPESIPISNSYGDTDDFREKEPQKTNGLSTNDDDFFHGDFSETISPSQNKPLSQFSNDEDEDNHVCGVATTEPTPLISKGQDTRPGQWPWHVSLYHSKGLQLQYICGGTLISKQHVVTAAHCVTKPSSETKVSKRNLLVYLGKYKLISFGPEVQDRDVLDIIVHPEYNATSYFNDIAVIKLTRPVKITNYVRTCCLWDEDSELESVENKVGTVVGWGFDENRKLSNKLMQAQMPIVPTIKCIYSNREFFLKYTFEKNFCAGFRNGTSVCNGDSGGGLLFPKRNSNSQNTIWQLRGLVSIGVALQTGQGVCDSSQYIVFTDVAKYTHWIRQVLAY